MARLDRYRIGIPRELSEIRTQPWLSEGSLTSTAVILLFGHFKIHVHVSIYEIHEN